MIDEKQRPAQMQEKQPGLQSEMTPQPKSDNHRHLGSRKLRGKVALITGGDNGIGRAVAIAFARQGADLAIVYLNEHQDAKDTQCFVEEEGRRCLTIAGDVGTVLCCDESVRQTVAELSRLDIL